jgi:cell division protein FtsN
MAVAEHRQDRVALPARRERPARHGLDAVDEERPLRAPLERALMRPGALRDEPRALVEAAQRLDPDQAQAVDLDGHDPQQQQPRPERRAAERQVLQTPRVARCRHAQPGRQLEVDAVDRTHPSPDVLGGGRQPRRQLEAPAGQPPSAATFTIDSSMSHSTGAWSSV